MKLHTILLGAGWIVLAAAGGIGLGYIQDNLTQYLSRCAFSMPVFYFGGAIGWLLGSCWYAAGIIFPPVPRKGLGPTPLGVLFILAWEMGATIGGTFFFFLNGMDYMTLYNVVVLSAWTGMAYSFVLVVLPILIFSRPWILLSSPMQI